MSVRFANVASALPPTSNPWAAMRRSSSSRVTVKLGDSLVFNPATMDYHAARRPDATILLVGPKGELGSAFKQQRELSYMYSRASGDAAATLT